MSYAKVNRTVVLYPKLVHMCLKLDYEYKTFEHRSSPSVICVHGLLRLSGLGPLVFLLLKTLNYAYLMKVIPKTYSVC